MSAIVIYGGLVLILFWAEWLATRKGVNHEILR
jgi:hypothetical protein